MQELDVTEAAGYRVLWIESDRLEEYLNAYKSGSFSALGINTARGYRARDIEFIERCPYVRALHVVPGIVSLSLRPLVGLNDLRSLVISGDCSDLQLADFPRLEEFRGNWHKRLLSDHAELRLLDISNYKDKFRD